MQADAKKIARLLKTAQGQLEGILKMVEEDRYCLEISGQIMAADAILRRANREVLQAHLDRCVLDAVESGDREKAGRGAGKADEIAVRAGYSFPALPILRT